MNLWTLTADDGQTVITIKTRNPYPGDMVEIGKLIPLIEGLCRQHRRLPRRAIGS